jgi:hypothetical protein
VSRRENTQKITHTHTPKQVSTTQAAKLNQILQRKAYNKLDLLTKVNGSITETVEESNVVLTEEHFYGSQSINETNTTNDTDTTGSRSR